MKFRCKPRLWDIGTKVPQAIVRKFDENVRCTKTFSVLEVFTMRRYKTNVAERRKHHTIKCKTPPLGEDLRNHCREIA